MNHFIKILILVSTFATSAMAAELSYEGYLRSPLGLNGQGGKFIGITNYGSQGNEFRIGNETPYAEASFTAKILKGNKPSDSFFETNLMFAYAPGFSNQYENGNGTSDLAKTYLVQAYVKGGNVDGIQAAYWAGKRFYRDADIHMNDFYYFADMSGVGAGVEAVPMAGGNFSLAYLQYSDDTVTNTSAGYPTKQALDFRLKDFALSSSDSLMFWVAEAYTAPGNGTGVVYSAATGTALGVKYHHKLEQGFNDLALVYGNGVMESLTLNADAYNSVAAPVDANTRTRFVEHYSSEISSKWGVHAAFVHDSLKGTTGAYTNWTSVGVRPVYYFTDHMHLVMQFGHSDVDGRTLDRITVAPEVAIGKGLFQRPVIRFYMAENMWNDANKSQTDPNSIVSRASANVRRALIGRNDEFQMGFEGEVWF